MNIFECCLLFGLVSFISSQLVSICKSVSSTQSIENGGETNNKESILFYKEMQNLKGDGCQKDNKMNNGSTGEIGTKGDPGVVNMTEIHELKLQLEQGEFHGRNSQ